MVLKGETMILPTGKPRNSPPDGALGFTPLEMRSLTGFTLIELLAVLLLIGILIGVSLPKFSATAQDFQLVNGARNLAKLLTYAQERAIVEKVPYQAVFDANGASYWLERIQQKESERVPQRIEGRYGRTTRIPAGIEFRFPEEPILFYTDGSSDPFSIELSAQGRRFILTHGIGYVRIQEEKG